MVYEQLLEKSFLTTFGPTKDPRDPTIARALYVLHHSDGGLKGVDCAKLGWK